MWKVPSKGTRVSMSTQLETTMFFTSCSCNTQFYCRCLWLRWCIKCKFEFVYIFTINDILRINEACIIIIIIIMISVINVARLFCTLPVFDYLYAILGTTLFFATRKNSPTARCVLAVNLVFNDVDFCRNPITLLKQILNSNLLYWVIIIIIATRNVHSK